MHGSKHARTHAHTHNRFTAFTDFAGTTQMSQHQKAKTIKPGR